MDAKNSNSQIMSMWMNLRGMFRTGYSNLLESKKVGLEAVDLMQIVELDSYKYVNKHNQLNQFSVGQDFSDTLVQVYAAQRSYLIAMRDLAAKLIESFTEGNLKKALAILGEIQKVNLTNMQVDDLYQICDQRLGIYRALKQEGGILLPDNSRLQFVQIPKGEFVFGQNSVFSKNQRTVYLDEFWISKTPITEEQFALFARMSKYSCGNENDNLIAQARNHPITYVNAFDAETFCKWLSAFCGLKIRLPSDEEWEKAARGIDGRQFPWGNTPPTKNTCNIAGMGINTTTPVGKYPEGNSPYGCEDMGGNVWEWTSSEGSTNGFSYMRGGSWRNYGDYTRCFHRDSRARGYRYDNVGFRVCVSIT